MDNKDWAKIRMKSLSYKYVKSKTDLSNKRVEFDSVSKSHANLRVVQLPSDKKSMQHDIEMLINFKTDIFLQCHTMQIVNKIYNSMALSVSQKIVTESQDNEVPIVPLEPSKADDIEDRNMPDENESLDESMHRYAEARHYARAR